MRDSSNNRSMLMRPIDGCNYRLCKESNGVNDLRHPGASDHHPTHPTEDPPNNHQRSVQALSTSNGNHPPSLFFGRTMMAPTKYLQRHDNVCKYVHDQLLLKYGFKESATAWYQYQPRAVEENENVIILWNFSVQTDHAIQHNKPDIIVIDKRRKVARTIDIAIPNDNNVCRKRFDKIRACAVEIKTFWGLSKCEHCANHYWCNWYNVQ